MYDFRIVLIFSITLPVRATQENITYTNLAKYKIYSLRTRLNYHSLHSF